YEVFENSNKIVTAEIEPFEEGFRFVDDRPCEHFIRKTKKCDIYNERPAVCRAFPILIKNENEYQFRPNQYCKYAVEFVVQKAITEITTCLKIREDPDFLKNLENLMEKKIPSKEYNLEDRVKKWNKIADDLDGSLD
ncbi:MAG: YkgJ family cysteine cluster protein, partial [Methanobacterium sp.]